MSAKKPDISKIGKYLKGELDNRAMHQFEREAQDDPFLMDAVEGYASTNKDQKANLDELKERLAGRIALKKQSPVILWRALSAAACLLLTIGIAYWIFKPKTIVKQYADLIEVKKPVESRTVTKQIPPAQTATKSAQKHAEPLPVPTNQTAPLPTQNSVIAAAKITDGKDKPIYKTDTVEYRANDYKASRNTKVDDVLKKMQGIQVEPDGSIALQGKQLTKARINGKDFAGGNVQAAAKNLPADVLEKVQVIDAVGDQATKAKKGTIDTLQLIAANLPARSMQLKEVAINSKETDNPTANMVTGKVVDETGAPIPGVTVKIKNNSAVTTTTDAQGNYKLKIPDNNPALDFIYLGYQPKELLAKNNTAANVSLQPSNSSLNEVVVVGYGTAKKRNTEPQPANGRKKYDEYIAEEAVMPDGTTDDVKLAFNVNPDGSITDIHITKGSNKAMNDKAIEIIKNGPKWIGAPKVKEIKLKISFHKQRAH